MKKIVCFLLMLVMALQLTACETDASKALKEANQAFEDERWSEAKNAASQIISNYPDTKEAEKAKQLIEDAERQIDYEQAEELIEKASAAYEDKQWKSVLLYYPQIEKLAPGSDLAERALEWSNEAKSAWIKELTENMQEAYENGEWLTAQSYAADIIEYFSDTDEARSAKKIKSDAADKMQLEREEARKKASRSRLRVSKCWVSGPDSAGGYELHINYENKSDQVIKYFRFGVTFYNAVGDAINTWRIDSIEYCEDTGPFAKGVCRSGNSVYWGKYYDSPIDHPEIVYIEVVYMNDSTWTLTKDEIADVQY